LSTQDPGRALAPTSKATSSGGGRADAPTLRANRRWWRSGHKFISLPTTASREPKYLQISHFKFKSFALQGGSEAAFDDPVRHENRNQSLGLRLDRAVIPGPSSADNLVVLRRVEQRKAREVATSTSALARV
jgi:hypothetical protein